MITVTVFGLANLDEYYEMNAWISDNSEAAWWDKEGPRSYINGTIVWSDALFENIEDVTLCKLMFPNIILYHVRHPATN